MKKSIIIFSFLVCCYSCNNGNDTSSEDASVSPKNDMNLNGVWKLVSFYNYNDNEVRDTILAKPENIQIKMYLDNKVMWSRRVPLGDEQFFGYGSYYITDSSLVEKIEYGSAAMLRAIDTIPEFNFELIRGKDSFTQIEIGPEGDRVLSENYIRIKK